MLFGMETVLRFAWVFGIRDQQATNSHALGKLCERPDVPRERQCDGVAAVVEFCAWFGRWPRVRLLSPHWGAWSEVVSGIGCSV